MIKDLSIKTQLIAGFFVLLAFVGILGWITYSQNKRLKYQSEIIHYHPMQVQQAVSSLRYNVLSIQRDKKSLFISGDERDFLDALKRFEVYRTEAREELKDIQTRYLGSPADVDSLSHALAEWNVMTDQTIQLFKEGNLDEALNRTRADGLGGIQVNTILKWIKVIEDSAINKEHELYRTSQELNQSLNTRMMGMLTGIFLVSILIYFVLWKNIRQPLTELERATRRFFEGDMSARSSYSLKNEFGQLSQSFNQLVSKIQGNIEIHKRISALSQLMLKETNSHRFFNMVLKALIEETEAKMAVVYLLDEEKKVFVHYESIGAGDQARQSFSLEAPEGELGLAVSTGKVQHMQNIQDDTRFLFYTSMGKIVPRELITIPIVDEEKTVAVFSLCNTDRFDQEAVHLVKMACDTLNARVLSVLALRRIQHFSKRLEEQNNELEIQKNELIQQSSELTDQNTELERQKRQLDDASRFKTSFLSTMSHELRTPLNSVIALTGVLSRRLSGKIPEEEHSYLDVVERNGKHLLSLINDILDLSQIESGKEDINISEFNACNIIEDVVNMILPQAQQNGIGLTKTCDSQYFPVISDASKIRHILINLVGNAVKFTEKGKVEVTGSVKSNCMEITIADTGIGIEEKNLSYIFDEFKQADSSSSRKFGGTGLGLAIARKYAHMLGGDIKVKSTYGRGSEFTLSIPLQYNPGNRAIQVMEPAGTENQKRVGSPLSEVSPEDKTILLVDDSRPAIIQMNDILEEYGYNVLIASNGEEALEIVKKTVPDAMVLDLMMPRMDGFQVLKTLIEAEPTVHVPVLILAAEHLTKEELAFLKRNIVYQLIQKGDVNRNDLLKAISDLLFAERKQLPGNLLHSVQGKALALVVEDNPDNMLTVKALLLEHYNVVEAVNGRQGVEMAKKYQPHFILMDIALPEMNGIEAFKSIRNDPHLKHIPVIALTASALTSDREIILAHGFDAYIPKPIDNTVFFETLESTLYGK